MKINTERLLIRKFEKEDWKQLTVPIGCMIINRKKVILNLASHQEVEAFYLCFPWFNSEKSYLEYGNLLMTNIIEYFFNTTQEKAIIYGYPEAENTHNLSLLKNSSFKFIGSFRIAI